MNQSVQERQLVLTESLNNQLQNVLANQQRLSASTEDLRRQNAELKKALEDMKAKSTESGGKRKRRRSSIEVPDALKVRTSDNIYFSRQQLYYLFLVLILIDMLQSRSL